MDTPAYSGLRCFASYSSVRGWSAVYDFIAKYIKTASTLIYRIKILRMDVKEYQIIKCMF